MRIQKIVLSNFQCFGEDPICIEFEEDITCFLGNNGSGKSAVIKVFSVPLALQQKKERL